MDQKIIQTLRTTSKLWLVVLSLPFLTACEKEVQKRHKDIFEIEVNGKTHSLSIVNNSGTPGKNAFIQGNTEDSEYYVSVRLDLCNLEAWPAQKRFPIFRDSCDYFNIGVTQSRINFNTQGTQIFYAYTVQSLIPDNFSEVVFEEFRGTSNMDYEIKGTFRMKLPGDDRNPADVPDSCLVTGRFHFKRPLVSPQ